MENVLFYLLSVIVNCVVIDAVFIFNDKQNNCITRLYIQ